MIKPQNRKTNRAAWWDYASNAAYFITICTADRMQYFGDIVSPQNMDVAGTQNMDGVVGTQNFAALQPTKIGEIAMQCWLDIPNHFPFIQLDAFVVMPDHVHGILIIDKPGYGPQVPGNKFGPQSQNLASVIRGYKVGVKKYATIHQIDFAWQSRFYEHIIKSDADLERIRNYILKNPENWKHKK